tara:strand:- start:38697 stop:39896 length:1200 start_codon:yes stop_codon:yes gene_type:complete
MRILHVLDHSIPLHSGYTFRTRNILRQQRKLGWDTCHVTGLKHTEYAAETEEVDGLMFYRTKASSSSLGKWPVLNQWDVVNTLAQRIEEVVLIEKPDILHAHSPALNGMAALRIGKKLGIPVVYECRAFWEDAAVDHGTSSEWGLRYRMTRAMETYVFKHANEITTICEGLRSEIAGRGISVQKISVIPNAVDVDDFAFFSPPDVSLLSELGLEGKTVLGFIGSFYAYEGLCFLLDALPAVLEHEPDVALLLVGGGPQESAIENRIQELGIGHAVVRKGRVPHQEVHKYYDLVDLFVYPRHSMRLTELVTPLKPLEAMAQGRLLIASDVGGHKELIEPGKTGYLFRADDQQSLIDCVVQSLAQRDEWPAIRRNGRAYVENERNWPVSVANYQSVYGALQ